MGRYFRDHLLPRLIQLSPELKRHRGARLGSTMEITNAVRVAASESGALCELEYPLDLYRRVRDGSRRRGHIDALITLPGSKRYAIEIDRTNKGWSQTKLQHCCHVLSCSALWIRWSGRISGEFPTGACVVDMTHSAVQVMGEENLNEPNQTPEPTALAVTPRACARVAPSSAVAHL